jgi:hypothetical protein
MVRCFESSNVAIGTSLERGGWWLQRLFGLDEWKD